MTFATLQSISLTCILPPPTSFLQHSTWFIIWVFPKIMVPPKSSHFNRVFQYKPFMLGYRYFWKHPNVSSWFLNLCSHINAARDALWIQGRWDPTTSQDRKNSSYLNHKIFDTLKMCWMRKKKYIDLLWFKGFGSRFGSFPKWSLPRSLTLVGYLPTGLVSSTSRTRPFYLQLVFISDEFLGFSQNLEVAGYPPSDKTRDIDLRCACLLFLDWLCLLYTSTPLWSIDTSPIRFIDLAAIKLADILWFYRASLLFN